MSFAFSRRDEAHEQGVGMFAAASNYGAIEGKKTAFPPKIVGPIIKISSTDGWGSIFRWNPDKSKNGDNFSGYPGVELMPTGGERSGDDTSRRYTSEHVE